MGCNQFFHVVVAAGKECMQVVSENNKNPQGHLMGSGTRKTKKEHNKYAVICIPFGKEFSIHWSTTSLTEHFSTKHVLVGASSSGETSG